tara:strand:- start:270 stop:572 length:303 start_codon:yes stop_codon:yes gene_type:complete
MKKVTLSVAALAIALTTFGQTQEINQLKTDSVTFSKWELTAMMVTLEDILEWQQQDMEDGDTNMGKYSEGWGSNYWLTEMLNEMMAKYNGTNDYIKPHNR